MGTTTLSGSASTVKWDVRVHSGLLSIGSFGAFTLSETWNGRVGIGTSTTSAAINFHTAVCEHLLSFPRVLAYAQVHAQEYGHILLPFVEQRLELLLLRKAQFQQICPNGEFDVSDLEAELLFYILRFLIHVNQEHFQALRPYQPVIRPHRSYLLAYQCSVQQKVP